MSKQEAGKKKLIYFLSHPIQYFSPLLKELAKHFDLKVYYCSDASIRGEMDKGFGQKVKWDIPLLEGYDHTFLDNYSGRKSLNNRFFDLFNPGVLSVLRKKPSAVVIINGWSYSSMLMIILFTRLFGKQLWLRSENPLNQELRKSKKVRWVKKIVLKHFLFRFVNRFLYIGKESRDFFKYYGIKDSRLIYTPYAVDNARFSAEAQQKLPANAAIRQQLNLPIEKKLVIFCGKYISKKRPLDLLKAFAALNDPAYFLVMVGEGELRTDMEQFITSHALSNVMLTGFINQSSIADYYAVADVFVMTSGMGETWGLSVNEAMNFQKPVIVSRTCGCHADLVEEGVNGFTYEEGNINELAAALKRVLDDDVFRYNAGKRSGEIVQRYSNEAIVEHIHSAL